MIVLLWNRSGGVYVNWGWVFDLGGMVGLKPILESLKCVCVCMPIHHFAVFCLANFFFFVSFCFVLKIVVQKQVAHDFFLKKEKRIEAKSLTAKFRISIWKVVAVFEVMVVNGGCGFDGGIINLLLFFSVFSWLSGLFIVSFRFASHRFGSFGSMLHDSGVKW